MDFHLNAILLGQPLLWGTDSCISCLKIVFFFLSWRDLKVTFKGKCNGHGMGWVWLMFGTAPAEMRLGKEWTLGTGQPCSAPKKGRKCSLELPSKRQPLPSFQIVQICRKCMISVLQQYFGWWHLHYTFDLWFAISTFLKGLNTYLWLWRHSNLKKKNHLCSFLVKLPYSFFRMLISRLWVQSLAQCMNAAEQGVRFLLVFQRESARTLGCSTERLYSEMLPQTRV